MSRLLRIMLLVMLFPAVCRGADFYVDPVEGKSSHDGSAARPWRSLQEVIDRGWVETRTWEKLPYRPGHDLVPKHEGAPIQPGDTIWLRSGDYGKLLIQNHYNEAKITIAAEKGQVPRFEAIHVQSGAQWVLRGLHVRASSEKQKRPRTLIDLESHGWRGPVSDIIVEDCVVMSAGDTSGWSAEDWNRRAVSGISADGTRMTIRRNRIKNVDFGIHVNASHSLTEENVVENFCGDGMRGQGDHSVFVNNTVKNCYDVNDNHDDGFQSWSHGEEGVGTSAVVGIVLRGNTFINFEDPRQPHRGPLQGIGCFDGMYQDWVIENNVVIVDHYHGITLLGARGCRIVNNTVYDPNSKRPGPAAIRIGDHKKGKTSENCLVQNNLASSLSVVEHPGNVVRGNRIIEDPETVFRDASRFDLRLAEDSPAIDAGLEEDAPEVDKRGISRPQGNGVDIGAYEFQK